MTNESTPQQPALRVTVTVDGRRWRRLAHSAALDGAGPDDRVFVLDQETGALRFGDGVHGAVPPHGSMVRVTYRSGGGADGNVGAAWFGTWPPHPFSLARALEPRGGRKPCS